ncbi:hypothetical protein A2Z67_04405 [Candidatus Woesebacteria bacterium RBG_13_36_22]|uniref:Uncharacterized protein n=1 Tax=Candidatus Woesebacteria bacterium RBG_13_36_22 TaxID=1802478 RepID=A0A1F7X234_9BACT|nr:MAG: hypothetical protein A2Z67_04405 [Candidatus Woesebacteria bacterium RBG_13_36_22]
MYSSNSSGDNWTINNLTIGQLWEKMALQYNPEYRIVLGEPEPEPAKDKIKSYRRPLRMIRLENAKNS